MAYEKIGFNKGDVLKAEHLNHIEEGIASVSTDCTQISAIIRDGAINQISISMDNENNLYNGGQGWKTGYRLNSSGGETQSDGFEVTGFIPFYLGDTIYLSGITMITGDSAPKFSGQYISVYDSTFTFITAGRLSDAMIASPSTTVVLGENNNLKSIVLDAGYFRYWGISGMKSDTQYYFRISAEKIDNNSILTVNEPTEGVGKTYLDPSILVPLAVENASRIETLESKIENIGSGTNTNNDIPVYVTNEAESVIDRVIAAQGNRTFTFAAISDLHYGNSNYTDGIKHACQALKYIDERIKLDAVAVLGDYTDGYPSTSLTDAMADYRAINTLLDNLRFSPNMRQMGNHDYYADNIPITRRLIQMYNDDAVWGNRLGGYYYKDFEDYKLRIICLNCNENNVIDTSTNKPSGNIHITTTQAQWFADILADVNTKAEAEEWQVLILSHQPLDWYDSQTNYILAHIVDAYHEGKSYSSDGVSCNYSDEKNKAKLICNIHGHIHNLLIDKVHTSNVVHGVKSNVYRMCTPEACINRSNQYDDAWKEAVSYPKTTNTSDDTSFVIYCIDLDTYTIQAICYGAGYDRTLLYHSDVIMYNITQTLNNVTSSNTSTFIASGGSFTTTLSANSGYELGTITVTIDGVDMTASVLSGNTITINNVAGNIVITATATLKPAGPTNQILNAIDTDGSPYNGGKGYKSGYRYNSTFAEAAYEGSLITGYIPYNSNVKVIRIKGFTANPINNDYCYTIDENFARKYSADGKNAFLSRYSEWLTQWPSAATFEMGSDGVGMITLNLEELDKISNTYPPLLREAAYIRFNITGAREDSFICTFDEEIV